jgi:type IV pilus assembly protein PilQ
MLPFVAPRAMALAVWLAVAPNPGSEVAPGVVTGLQILPAPERTEVLIQVQGDVQTRDFTMEGPARLVVDLMGARFAGNGEGFPSVERGGIRSARASQYTDDVVRVVLELDEIVGHSVISGDGFVRVSLDTRSGSFQPWSVEAQTPEIDRSQGVEAATPAPANGAELQELAVPARAQRRPSGWSGIASDEFARRITVSFTETPMRDVLFTFAEFSGRSIVPGVNVAGNVNADIREQPWDVALQTILESHGLAAREYESGIIRVDRLQDLTERAEVEQLVTRPFRVNYGSAQDMIAPVESLLSSRGRISVSSSTNSLVVTDVSGVLESVEELLEGLDLETPEISISAKIIFVNRTDLAEFGIVYDLKDTQGNQLNLLTPGGIFDADGNLVEQVDAGTNVISLRGNSIAALGNASERVSSPSLQFLTSIVMGRMTLLSFVEALESVQLSDIQAAPQVKVLDNRPARIQVGERTPVRGVQQQQQQQQDGGLFIGAPQIEFVETGIILEVTPTVTAGDLIFMDLRAERSGVEEVGIELGYRFNTQEAETQVLVEDGETVVIGGLTVTEVDETRVGIPILQHVPYLGRLFRYTSESRTQQDLIILVTPQITRR